MTRAAMRELTVAAELADFDVHKMTLKEFRKLPVCPWDKIVLCDSLVLLPTSAIHDSDYRCLYFVPCEGKKPLCLMSGSSDVLHLDGIGGAATFGILKKERSGALLGSWNIDCLPVSGLFRLFSAQSRLKCGPSLSSFEVYAIPMKGGNREKE